MIYCLYICYITNEVKTIRVKKRERHVLMHALKQNRRSATVTAIIGTTALHETDKYCQLQLSFFFSFFSFFASSSLLFSFPLSHTRFFSFFGFFRYYFIISRDIQRIERTSIRITVEFIYSMRSIDNLRELTTRRS